MGEESDLGGYVKFGDGEWQPVAHITMDEITEKEPEDCFVTNFIRTFSRGSVEGSITVLLQRKGIRKLYRHVGFPEYYITEWLFPKKKKRGTARRKRRIKVYRQRFIKFMNDKYGCGLIGTKATNVIIDDFFIPDDVVPPVEVESERTPICEYMISKDELPAFAGPFEGEED